MFVSKKTTGAVKVIAVGAKKTTDAAKVYAAEEGPSAEEEDVAPTKVAAVKKSLAAKLCETLEKTVEKDKSLDGAREQQVPNSYLIPIWIIAKCVFIAALVGLTTTSFQADFTKKYLSPSYVFGDVGNYRLCDLIPSSFSGSYLLDSNGYWQGTTSFSVGKAKYSVTLNDFSHTYKEYGEIMASLKSAISTVAANAATSAVKDNLLTWMSFAWVYIDGSVQHVMRFVGDPAVVLNRTYKLAALMNRYVPCAAQPDVSINVQGDVVVSYPIFNFGQASEPSMGMKGCCKAGTVYTQIGNPKPRATEISATWGVVATHTWSSSVTSNVALSIVSPPATTTTSTQILLTVGVDNSTFNEQSSLIGTLASTVTSSYQPYALCFGPTYTGKTGGTANCATVSSIAPTVVTATTTAASGPFPSATVLVSSAAGIVAGMTVTGTGIPAGARISSVSPSPTPSPGPFVTLSALANVASGVTLGFTAPDVTITGTTASSSNTITSVSSTAGIVAGMTVTGTGIPVGATVSSVSPSPTPSPGPSVTLSSPATAAGAGVSLTFSKYFLRTGTTASSSNTITSVSSTAGIVAGMRVTGTGIPAGTTVSAIPSSTSLTLSSPATAAGAGVSLTFTSFLAAATFTLSSGVPYSSSSKPRLIDASKITTEDLEFVGYTPREFELRQQSFYPKLTVATEKFVYYASKYPGYLDASSGGDMTASCVITPTEYGYNDVYDTAEFSMTYNLRSLITAVAVNRGYLPLSALQEIFTALKNNCVTNHFTVSSDGYCQFTYQGDTYQIHTYIDTKFDHMAPIFCLERQREFDEKTDNFQNLCLLRVRDSFVYPFFDHMGTTSFSSGASDAAFYDPTYSCVCADDTYSTDYLNTQPYSSGTVTYTYKIRGSQKSDNYCNVLDLMHGFVMMGKTKLSTSGISTSDTKGLYAVTKILQMAYANTASDLAKYAYVAGFMSLRLSYGTQILDSPSDNKGWAALLEMYNEKTTGKAGPFQFCNGYAATKNNLSATLDSAGTAYGEPDCSIFAMNTFDSAEPALSNFHLNVLLPHCTDEFSMPNSSWGRNTTYRYNTTEVPPASNEMSGLGALYVPPQSLTQSYYICYNKWSTSLALAFGSSAGTAGIAGSVVISILVGVVSAGWFKKKGKGEGEGVGVGEGEEKKRGGYSKGEVMMVGTVGAGVAVEASTKK